MMSRLRTLLVLLCMSAGRLTGAWELIKAYGYMGADAHIYCTYPQGYEGYEKYLCQNNCEHDSDVLVTTSQVTRGRYSTFDRKSIREVTLTISNPRFEDAGRYWCGVTRNGVDIYKKVELAIMQDICCRQVIQVHSYVGNSVSFTCRNKAKYETKLKYICRGNQPSSCLQQAVVTSDQTTDERFALTNGQKVSEFTVTMNRLTLEDSGLYLCGIHPNIGVDSFTAVWLDVSDWCCITSNTMKGKEGQSVTLECPYPPQHRDNRKFLCKGERLNNCTEVATDHEVGSNNSRFSLQDDTSTNSFSVTVTELEAGDAGMYWCGSDAQWSVANYTKIRLSVQREDVVPLIEEPPSDPTLPVVLSVVPVILVLIIVPLILWRKHHKRREAEDFQCTNFPEVPNMMGDSRSDARQGCDNDYDDGAGKDTVVDADDDDEPEYGNITGPEDIYCNQ